MMRPPRCWIIGLSTACAQRERRRQVGGEHLVPVVALHAQHQLVAGDAGVVDQDVDPAVRCERAVDQRVDRGGVGHVDADAPSAWPPGGA